MVLRGRKQIFTTAKEIDKSNIVEVLQKSYAVHLQNVREIQFLRKYDLGYQPLQREKKIRSDINIIAIDNVANYVKDFWVGYLFGSPVKMVQRGNRDTDEENETINEGIAFLNNMLTDGNKIGKLDEEVGEDVQTFGIGYKFVDIKTDFESTDFFGDGEIDTYVDICNLNPEFAFCVYSSNAGHKKMLGVTYCKTETETLFTCFTDRYRFEISSSDYNNIVVTENLVRKIPIVEYQRVKDRTGCFERQIPLLDSLNILTSDFANDVSQKTQEVWWGNDIDFPKDKETGALIAPKSGQWVLTYTAGEKNPKIQPLASQFNSASTLSAIASTRSEILKQCYVPMQSESEGGGSTGIAMDISSGWSAAEVQANKEQQYIDASKREELELILRSISFVSNEVLPSDHPLRQIRLSDIELHFNRKKNYDMAIKANTFATLVAHGINGRHALKVTEMFEDTEQVWIDSKDGIEEYQKSTYSTEKTSDTETDRIMSDNSDQITNSPNLDGLETKDTE